MERVETYKYLDVVFDHKQEREHKLCAKNCELENVLLVKTDLLE